METQELLIHIATIGASDLHITVGSPPICRLHGRLHSITEQVKVCNGHSGQGAMG